MENIFGNNIKKIRKEKKLTQSQLAKLINKSLSSVQKYEAGDVSIPLEVVELISNKLKVPSSKIIGGMDADLYKNKTIIDFLGLIGYSVEVISLPDSFPNEENEIYLLENGKEEIQLSSDEMDSFIDDIMKYTKFLISDMDKDKNYLEEIDISDYLTESMISHLKGKVGYYGDKLIEPLNSFEEQLWEKYLELYVKDKD